MATDPTEHAETVLAAIIPGRKDLLDRAQRQLSEEHFAEKTHKQLFVLLGRYAEITGTVMPQKHVADLARKKMNPEQAALLVEVYETLAERDVPETDFYWSINELREWVEETHVADALAESMEVLRKGKTMDDGAHLKGPTDAREFLASALHRIEHDLKLTETSEGDMRDESRDMLNDYAERKKAFQMGESRGINFGVQNLDEKVGGLQRGDLVIVAGYSSDGKTSLVVQLAWSAAVEQGKNVVFFTTETLRHQVRRKILARHSNLKAFGLKQGLNTKHIKAGTLSKEHEEVYQNVIKDFTGNPSYGKLHIAQVPRGATIASLEARLNDLKRQFDVDLVIMDYLALLATDRKRQSSREELAGLMKEAKQVATTFNDSQGVPFVTPWQVSREARMNAERTGQYTSAALSETAEATNSADVIVGLLAPSEKPDPRAVEASVQVLKNRDGEVASGLQVEIDYATSRFKSQGAPTFAPALGATQQSSIFN